MRLALAGVGLVALGWLADRLHNQVLWSRAGGSRVQASILYGREPGKANVTGPLVLFALVLALAWGR